MTISDIITLISLVIAIVAIINEKNRKHLLLKFNKFDFIIYLSGFFLINYFVFYDSFFENGIFIKSLYFERIGFKDPKKYSYIISIFILLSILYKILYSFYPYKKRWKVESYYNRLIEENEISMLCDLIDKYHTGHIVKRIQSSDRKTLEANHETLRQELHCKPLKTKLKIKVKSIWLDLNNYSEVNKFNYATIVLYNIINNPAFIKLASNSHPFFFAKIISSFKKEKAGLFPDDLAKKYLTELIGEKNFWLTSEVKQAQNFGSGLPKSYFKFNKISNSLLFDLSVAEVNDIWLPFGEGALNEIRNERNKGDNSEFKYVVQNEEELWRFKTFISINFFNTLIIEAILKNYNHHFFLTYYWHISDEILKNMEMSPNSEFEIKKSTYHYFIEKINENLFNWLRLANKSNSDLFFNIINCIGNQINSLMKSSEYGEGRKVELIRLLLNLYCTLKSSPNYNEIVDELEKMMKQPSRLTTRGDVYYKYFNVAWDQFDKIPHRFGNQDLDYFRRLKENVIIPLGLDPDQH